MIASDCLEQTETTRQCDYVTVIFVCKSLVCICSVSVCEICVFFLLTCVSVCVFQAHPGPSQPAAHLE